MVVVQISQADGRNEDRTGPANGHRHDLHKQHEERVHKKCIISDDEAHNAFINKPSIGIQQRI